MTSPWPDRESALPAPVAMQAVPGTPYAIAMVGVSPTVSGPAIASLVAGLGATVVSLVVICFAAVGAEDGWGPIVAGAFAVLAAVLSAGGLGLGLFATRQIRRYGRHRVTGRGLALAGISLGAAGLGLTALAMVLAVALVA